MTSNADAMSLKKAKIARRSGRLLLYTALPVFATAALLFSLGGIHHTINPVDFSVTTVDTSHPSLALIPLSYFAYLIFVRLTKRDPLRLYRASLPMLRLILKYRHEFNNRNTSKTRVWAVDHDSITRGMSNPGSRYYAATGAFQRERERMMRL